PLPPSRSRAGRSGSRSASPSWRRRAPARRRASSRASAAARVRPRGAVRRHAPWYRVAEVRSRGPDQDAWGDAQTKKAPALAHRGSWAEPRSRHVNRVGRFGSEGFRLNSLRDLTCTSRGRAAPSLASPLWSAFDESEPGLPTVARERAHVTPTSAKAT